MVVAEFPKLFDIQCIWGRIFVSLENVFVFNLLSPNPAKWSNTLKQLFECVWNFVKLALKGLSVCRIYFFQFLREIYMERMLQELFWELLTVHCYRFYKVACSGLYICWKRSGFSSILSGLPCKNSPNRRKTNCGTSFETVAFL